MLTDALGDEVRNQQLVLTKAEVQWRDRFSPLKERGYLLRPRYRPGWVPTALPIGLGYNEDHIMIQASLFFRLGHIACRPLPFSGPKI